MGVAAIRLPPNARALCLQNRTSSETNSQRKEYGQHGLGRLPVATLYERVVHDVADEKNGRDREGQQHAFAS
jgi:hypothetical protein